MMISRILGALKDMTSQTLSTPKHAPLIFYLHPIVGPVKSRSVVMSDFENKA